MVITSQWRDIGIVDFVFKNDPSIYDNMRSLYSKSLKDYPDDKVKLTVLSMIILTSVVETFKKEKYKEFVFTLIISKDKEHTIMSLVTNELKIIPSLRLYRNLFQAGKFLQLKEIRQIYGDYDCSRAVLIGGFRAVTYKFSIDNESKVIKSYPIEHSGLPESTSDFLAFHARVMNNPEGLIFISEPVIDERHEQAIRFLIYLLDRKPFSLDYLKISVDDPEKYFIVNEDYDKEVREIKANFTIPAERELIIKDSSDKVIIWNAIMGIFSKKSDSKINLNHKEILEKLKTHIESGSYSQISDVQVTIHHSLQESGSDTTIHLSVGEKQKQKVGMQLKVDSDLEDPNWQSKVKAQITESRRYGYTYFILAFAIDTNRKIMRNGKPYSIEKSFAEFKAFINQLKDDYVILIEPENLSPILNQI